VAAIGSLRLRYLLAACRLDRRSRTHRYCDVRLNGGLDAPVRAQGLGFDPATASAPFVAMLVDVTGLVIYFTVAYAVLRGTLL
jgi:hypothetical protein